MARSGRWTVAQLDAAIGGVLAGASYKTVERLTGVLAATVHDHMVSLVSRSRTRKRKRRPASSRAAAKLRAAW
jgi:hypothetical protein